MGKRGWQRASSDEPIPTRAGAADGVDDVDGLSNRPEQTLSQRCRCVCGIGALVLVGSTLVAFSLLSMLAPSMGSAAGMDRLDWFGAPGVPKVLPPVPPEPSLPPPPPPERPPAHCFDQNPKPDFCLKKASQGLCEQRRIVLQCALSCGACQDVAPSLPPPHGLPLHPPLHPPPPYPPWPLSPPSPPPPSPALPLPAPPPPPMTPETICSRLGRLQETEEGGYCFASVERQASREKCESAYVRLSGGRLLPCIYDAGLAKCKGQSPPVVCSELTPPPGPSSPPPPPMRPPLDVVGRLNERFQTAVQGSSKLSEIGVIMHAFDATEDPEAPWAPCPEGNEVCGFLHNMVSASVVYLGKTNAYTVKGGGVVLNPRYARVKCGYPGDAGTREKRCRANAAPGCVDGCGIWSPDGGGFLTVYCDAKSAGSGYCDGRPWRPKVREDARPRTPCVFSFAVERSPLGAP